MASRAAVPGARGLAAVHRPRGLAAAPDPRGLAAFLRAGGVVAYATRACFGLGCLPGHRGALRRLIRLKRRPLHKGLIVVADRLDRLDGLIEPLDPVLGARARSRWPGQWTWLIACRPSVPALLRGRHRSLAVRVDDYPPVATLCARLGTALVSTSANRSGRQPARTTRAVRRAFGDAVRVIDGRCQRGSRPSTIADLASGRVLRA